MDLVKSFITDSSGKVKDVIISYEDYKKIEEIILDTGLGKSMEDIIHEEEFDLETAKNLAGFKDGSKV
jgi:hypothetical protein